MNKDFFAKQLKKIRRWQGISQEELAEKLEVSRQSIGKWESGKVLPSLDKAVLLAEALEVSVDYLVNDRSD